MKKDIYRFSLCLNLVFIFFSCFVLVKKHDAIKYRLIKSFEKNEVVDYTRERGGANSDSFDRIPYLNREERIENNEAQDDFSILVIGNSLALHEKNIDIGWNHESGMAASSLENDYVHKLCKMISDSKNVNINLKIINAADFERNVTIFDETKFIGKENKYDLLIIQLGENISDYDITINSQSIYNCFSKLLQLYTADVKILCLPFWFSSEENEIFTNVAM